MTSALEVPAAGVGVWNGTSTKAAFDRWFRYPAGLSQDALARLFDHDRNPHEGPVVDPFCGAGTVGTRAACFDWAFVGAEAHPEIAELARLKLAPSPDVDAIVQAGEELLASAVPVETIDAEHELVRRCFSPDVLAALTGLRDGIQAGSSAEVPYLKWALLATLRDVANVKVGWPYLRPGLARNPPHTDVAARYRVRLGWMADDLRARTSDPVAEILQGDSGDAKTWLRREGEPKGSVALTSPPYLNNFDYADATRLEMFFWGRNASWAEMVADVRSDMLIATTQQATVVGADAATSSLSELPKAAATVERLTTALAEERGKRRAGKAYDRVLPEYALGISRVLRQLQWQLEPGSWTGWVVGDSAPYGIYVDTPGLIQNIALELGYTNPQSEILRSRGLRWRTNGTRHQMALNERLIWMRTPGS
ncbi:hypothetical protein [Modestobacter sp. SSW1-42]|uniref:hypothetical protein n=1 Tax=Modestobacter sp. SSW1-42 TaxID=596372 RepID=UPI003986C375